ncbi:MAG: lycopene cyclase domain-containing protein [Actinobacteria bacterium]|nr:lycopene cyclase domain-containing protein [Actinomycetota bacterium]
MADRWQYLALMAACLVVTLPLELFLRARVYRRPRRLLLALVPTLVAFTVWDLVGIVRHHWTYSPLYTTGFRLGVVPVEELVFFVVVPVCALLTYEAVGTVMQRGRKAGHA